MRIHVKRLGATIGVVLSASLLAPGFAYGQGHRPSQSFPSQAFGGRHGLGTARDEANLLRQRNPLADDRIPDVATLREARGRQMQELMRLHKDVIDKDPRGEPVLKRQVLVVSPSKEVLATFVELDFVIASTRRLPELDLDLTVLLVPPKFSSTNDALLQLQAIAPDVIMDFDHLYTGSETQAAPVRSPIASTDLRPSGARHSSDEVKSSIGLIDGGVDANHVVFQQVQIKHWGCEDKLIASEHGTAVGSLMVGKSERFNGVAPGSTLFAADVYCGVPTGGSASDIALALAWLAQNEVPVVNISLVGPSNRILEKAVLAMIRKGHLLTAAVGNDGPAAPPLYPASYPGVIGVSAVDDRRRVLPEAARGPQVAFVAPGSKMIAARPGEPRFRMVRGTSFASPIVAALLALRMNKPGTGHAASAVAELAKHATGGNDARSTDTGWGLVGEAYRISPD